jgi:DNA-binding MarR family transcriptional regulator
MSDSTETPTAGSTCHYIIGDDGLARWPEGHADAWIGLIETQKALTRALDAELEVKHGLRLSAAEALGRLAAAPGRRLGLSRLASECGLSLSRISRVIDALEQRGLVERRTCDSDARATEAHLTADGLSFTLLTQATHVAFVQEHFFELLSPAEIATLAEVFNRFAPRAAEACTAGTEGNGGQALTDAGGELDRDGEPALPATAGGEPTR